MAVTVEPLDVTATADAQIRNEKDNVLIDVVADPSSRAGSILSPSTSLDETSSSFELEDHPIDISRKLRVSVSALP
jgi:hypothetical protein